MEAHQKVDRRRAYLLALALRNVRGGHFGGLPQQRETVYLTGNAATPS